MGDRNKTLLEKHEEICFKNKTFGLGAEEDEANPKPKEKKRMVEMSNVQEATGLKRLYSVEEAAHYLGLSPRTIYNGVAPKSKNPFGVKPRRIGKKVLFDIKDLNRYIDSLDSKSN